MTWPSPAKSANARREPPRLLVHHTFIDRRLWVEHDADRHGNFDDLLRVAGLGTQRYYLRGKICCRGVCVTGVLRALQLKGAWGMPVRINPQCLGPGPSCLNRSTPCYVFFLLHQSSPSSKRKALQPVAILAILQFKTGKTAHKPPAPLIQVAVLLHRYQLRSCFHR
jgi:hypothetical protein